MKKNIMYILIIFITFLILISPQNAIKFAREGLDLCYEMIIPSLFPFFICSGLLIYSGFAEVLTRIFTPVMLPLFRINGSGASAFVLGIISGYPLGAVTACSLYESNYLSKTETERLLAFCNNSGPLFILGSVGISLYHSPEAGWLLYIAHLLAALTVGILFRFYNRNEYIAPKTIMTQPERNIGEIFSIVLQNSLSSIFTVCGTIVFFSILAKLIINMLSPDSWYTPLLMGIIEFTTGTVGIAGGEFSPVYKLILSSFIVGFAGLSVHFQVMGIVAKYGLSLKPYILGKLLHALFAGLYVFIILKFIPVTVNVFSSTQSPLDINGSFAMSSLYVCTAVMCIIAVGFIFGIGRVFVWRKR